MTLHPGIIYRTSDGGIITFENTITSSKIYFDEFLMFNDLNGDWSQIGFKCTPSTANMTIDALDKSRNGGEITLSVDAPALTESVSKIYFGDFGKPTSVVGASFWSYSYSSKTVTIKVVHASPQDIVIKWENVIPAEGKEIFVSIWVAYAMVGLILLTLVSGAIFAAYKGNIDLSIFMIFLQLLLITLVSMFFLASWSGLVMVGLISLA